TLTDPAAIAKAMESYVRTNLKNKNFSTALASAGEVARNLEGDCTEHAVLLAAMLRAKGIPSRVAVGLVYIEGPSAFGGHMWTEARLNDQWVPIDGTLGRGGIGATHIKLGDATFADANGAPLATFTSLITVIGKLQIEVREVQ
ncbi:MAG: transglutaminase-like domain-containing protein, partial [Planctomycetaceae bacterium]|nr:transglutaminase-like domain-containing protein [Planctomycetaceae bacterium]